MKSSNESTATPVWPILAMGVLSLMVTILALPRIAHAEGNSTRPVRGQIGKDSKKILVRDGKTLLWAGGDVKDPDKSHWYDFTNASVPAEQLQFGIGKDRIKAIDDPLFVKPDDARLEQLSKGWFRRGKKRKSVDDLLVMGYVINGEARCYPSALLNRHELVNDRYGNKPVTVGW